MKHIARKRFGQNFLHDQGIIQQIIHAINPQPNENIVEIGPGKGALTEPLLSRTEQLNVIELDRDLIPILQNNLGHPDNFYVHNVDALKYDYSQLADDKNSLRIVGNLPYNISTPLLFHLMKFAPIIKDMHFMLQKEVVDRMVAKPNSKAYGRLGVILQYYCTVEKLFIVKPGAFFPPPKVDSAIVRLIPHKKPPVDVKDEAVFAKVLTQCFRMRRKTLRNNLKETLTEDEIISVGINPSCRSETLTIAEFALLANIVAAKNKEQE